MMLSGLHPLAVSACAALALMSAPASAQATTRVSVDRHGVEGNLNSSQAVISADGRSVAFQSLAWNLVHGDTNGVPDIFVHDRHAGTTMRVSVSSLGLQSNSACFGPPAISADSGVVAFWTLADNLVAGDSNFAYDVFVRELATAKTARISLDSTGIQGNGSSYTPVLSADGRFVAFESFASNLVAGDTNGTYDVFVHDRLSGQTARVSVNDLGQQGNALSELPAISADGRYVAFSSQASNLVPGDANGVMDVFVHDRQSGITTRVSVGSGGAEGNDASRQARFSADGRVLCFESLATNLVPRDVNGASDVFIHDLQSGVTSLASAGFAGQPGNAGSYAPALSADGGCIAFYSYASNLVGTDTNGESDVFVLDRASGRTARCSRPDEGNQAHGGSHSPTISGDGRFVAFESNASDLVRWDTNGKGDIFVRDRAWAFALGKSGVCPGVITLTVTGATPFGRVGILFGPAGSVVTAQSPCPGLQLDIQPPTPALLFKANTSGNQRVILIAPPSACGLGVQAVDLASCVASNLVVL